MAEPAKSLRDIYKSVDKVSRLGRELPVEDTALADLVALLADDDLSDLALVLEAVKVLRNAATNTESQEPIL
jgi:hypothetical protein